MADSVKPSSGDAPEGVEPEQKNKMLIVQILNEMHNVFNNSTPNQDQGTDVKDGPPPSPGSVEDSSSVVFEAQRVEEDLDDPEEKAESLREDGTVAEDEPTKTTSSDSTVEAGLFGAPEHIATVASTADDASVAEDVFTDAKTTTDDVAPPEIHSPVECTAKAEACDAIQPVDIVEPEELPLSQETQAEPVSDDVTPDDSGASPANAGSDIDQFHEAPSGISEESDLGGVVEEKPAIPKKRHVGRPRKAETLARVALLDQTSKVEVKREELTEKPTRRSLRSSDKVEQDVAIKRSSRRMSKDYNRESVLQNAIARKEKSLNSFSEEKPRRSTRLSEDPKASSLPHRSPKSKASRSSASADEGATSNGDPASSPLRCIKRSSDGDHDDTASDVSSRSVKKLRSLGFSLKNSPKLSSKESLAMDEDSASSWQAQPPADLLSDKEADCPSRSTLDRSESGSSSKEAMTTATASDTSTSKIGMKGDDSSPTVNLPEGSEPPNLEGDCDLPPVSAATALLCECEVSTSMYTRESSNQLCRALDVYENRLVKCANDVDEVPLLRCCKTKPFLALCLIHFERMIRHMACPTCGSFCTQGVVNICENKHFFHKNCDLKMEDSLVCPHCGTESYSLHKIQLQNHRYPLFLPSTKPLNRLPVAKMSISRHKVKTTEDVGSDLSDIVPSSTLTLPNGRVISTEGIPLPERVKLIQLIETTRTSDDVRYTYRSLYQAAKTGDAEKVLTMLGVGMSPNQVSMNPLMGAAREGHLLVVHLLVQAGANLETLDKNQFTPLMLAAQNKHNAVVKYLVKSGADVGFKGADGMTALHIAAKEGNLEACHYILSQPNLPASFIDTVDDGRWTALVWAAENCHSKVVRYLLEKRADPQIRDSEMNIALHWSAFAGSMEITEDLLSYGCNINLSNTHGDTPLHIAARQGADYCVVLLLARGANVDVMNKAGQLPRDCVVNKDSYCFTAIDLNMRIKKSVSSRNLYPRILCNDVSGGREENPIQCVNAIDDDPIPTDYTYVTENCFTSNVTIDRRISSLMFCKCEDGCSGNGCMCTKISRGCWYDNTGKLLPEFSFEDPPILFECNPACGCNVLTCKNRVVQKGLKSRLQLVKTKNKSWGVITLKEIPKGTYVCEYIGEIISDLEADTRKDDSYLFDLDNAESETYCLDARKYGNICRFINHSCRPNLSPVKIYFQHQDLHFPRIAMFASRDIAANEELGFDYGEKFWIIKCKSFTCHCGEPTCRYSESNIQQTLDKYQQKLRELDEMSDSA